MSRIELYKCELCHGCKTESVIYGVIPKHLIELTGAKSLLVNTHLCITCIEQIKTFKTPERASMTKN